ncbi:MAG: nuclear transport factor 2 family protein [Promethearchaeota archaeon]|jgi:ketosteroid isomerase-like protein
MNTRDPKLIVLQYNEYINNQDLKGLSSLMSKDYIFIDRNGDMFPGNEITGWKGFFKDWPTYKNIFTRVESRENLVIAIGYALWSMDSKEEDHVIWVATIENDLVVKWQIFEETEENRQQLGLK